MLKQELYNINLNLSNLIAANTDCFTSLRNKVLDQDPYYKVLSPTYVKFASSNLQQIAKQIRMNFRYVIVIAMGGSHLNPASLVHALAISRNTSNDEEALRQTEILFLDSTETTWIEEKLSCINLADAAILTISKSGETLETNAIFAAIIARMQSQKISLIQRCYFITKSSECSLQQAASAVGGVIIPHDQDVSGRYAGLTNVSFLPALIMGIDVDSYVGGAVDVLEAFVQNNDHPALEFASVIHTLHKCMLVNITYASRLTSALAWLSQIIAESLGKNKAGFTPLVSKGPEDQHSMYQLYLDGPDDKFYSYFCVEDTAIEEGGGILENSPLSTNIAGLEYLRVHSLEKIHNINENASFAALQKIARPMRKLTLEKLSARNIGSLVAHLMIEVIAIGELMGINPFNQDGVELIKTESRAYMLE